MKWVALNVQTKKDRAAGRDVVPLLTKGGTLSESVDAGGLSLSLKLDGRNVYSRMILGQLDPDNGSRFIRVAPYNDADGGLNLDQEVILTQAECTDIFGADSVITVTGKGVGAQYAEWITIPDRSQPANINLDPEANVDVTEVIAEELDEFALFNQSGTAGQYLAKLFRWCQATPNHAIRGIKVHGGVDRLQQRDARGRAWTATQKLTFPFGTSLADVLRRLEELQMCSYRWVGNELFLYLWNEAGRDLTGGENIARFGANVTLEAPARYDLTNLVTRYQVLGPANTKVVVELPDPVLKRLGLSYHIGGVLSRTDIIGDGAANGNVQRDQLRAAGNAELYNGLKRATEQTLRTRTMQGRFIPGRGIKLHDRCFVPKLAADGSVDYYGAKLVGWSRQWGSDTEDGHETANWTFGRRMRERILDLWVAAKNVNLNPEGRLKNRNDPYYVQATGKTVNDEIEGRIDGRADGRVMGWIGDPETGQRGYVDVAGSLPDIGPGSPVVLIPDGNGGGIWTGTPETLLVYLRYSNPENGDLERITIKPNWAVLDDGTQVLNEVAAWVLGDGPAGQPEWGKMIAWDLMLPDNRDSSNAGSPGPNPLTAGTSLRDFITDVKARLDALEG